MELFRTPVIFPAAEKKIHYGSGIMLLGSCFSEYIGEKFAAAKFTVDNNPFGILYNPLSVKKALSRLMANNPYPMSELFRHNNLWYSFDHHSRFSGANQDSVLNGINRQLTSSADSLGKADFIFITFGTSFVYYLKSTSQVVSNCHKMPAELFERRKISAEEIINEYTVLLDELFRLHPAVNVIFTVSPVRHWKDGAHENQLSKASLLLAIDQICKVHKQATYFPSYEIMMDDLRDYRFYGEDMLHPNAMAINYIWQRVRECFMDVKTLQALNEVEKIMQAVQHRPFNPDSENFAVFAAQFTEKIHRLKEKYNIDMVEEEKYFRSFL